MPSPNQTTKRSSLISLLACDTLDGRNPSVIAIPWSPNRCLGRIYPSTGIISTSNHHLHLHHQTLRCNQILESTSDYCLLHLHSQRTLLFPKLHSCLLENRPTWPSEMACRMFFPARPGPATGALGCLHPPTDRDLFHRYYPTERLISKKGRKHYRIPVRSQYVEPPPFSLYLSFLHLLLSSPRQTHGEVACSAGPDHRLTNRRLPGTGNFAP